VQQKPKSEQLIWVLFLSHKGDVWGQHVEQTGL
jgi:hypothetical protein